MEYLFQKVKVLDPRSKYHQKTVDVFIKDGIIADIKKEITVSSKVKNISSQNAHLSPGWIDVGTTINEPGLEHRETLEATTNAALAGGYTGICSLPNTKPAIHSKSEIEFLINRSKALPISIFPLGAISKDCKGIEMAEILQMIQSGAVGFCDGNIPLQNSGLFMRTLEYIKMSDKAVLLNIPCDLSVAPGGQMNESETSTYLGLRGIPTLSETIGLHRDLEILKYVQSKYLAHKISSGESVNMIKKAKQKYKELFASVSIFNLVYTDEQLAEFDSNLKVFPPLRSADDRKSLIKGLLDNTIDIICSDHHALEPEKKDIEFQKSEFGSINLETAYGLFQSNLSTELDTETWINKVAISPREIFDLESNIVEVGQSANLTWFDPKAEWVYAKSHSRSKNSNLFQKKLIGKVLGTFVKSNFFSNTYN